MPSEDVSHSNSDKDDNNTLHKTDDLRYDDDMRYLSILSVCLGMICPETISELDKQGKQQVAMDIEQQEINIVKDEDKQLDSTSKQLDNAQQPDVSGIFDSSGYGSNYTNNVQKMEDLNIYCYPDTGIYQIPLDINHQVIFNNDNTYPIYLKEDFSMKSDGVSDNNDWLIEKKCITFRSNLLTGTTLMIAFVPTEIFNTYYLPDPEIMQINAYDSNLTKIRARTRHLSSFIEKCTSNYYSASSSQSTSSHTPQELKPMIKTADAKGSSSTDLHPLQR